MKYYYFISGFFTTEEEHGFLRFEYSSEDKITSLEEIRHIEEFAISELNLKNCMVLNYHLLRNED